MWLQALAMAAAVAIAPFANAESFTLVLTEQISNLVLVFDVTYCCSEKIKRELGWRPQHSDIEAIVRSAWEWHRLHTSTLK